MKYKRYKTIWLAFSYYGNLWSTLWLFLPIKLKFCTKAKTLFMEIENLPARAAVAPKYGEVISHSLKRGLFRLSGYELQRMHATALCVEKLFWVKRVLIKNAQNQFPGHIIASIQCATKKPNNQKFLYVITEKLSQHTFMPKLFRALTFTAAISIQRGAFTFWAHARINPQMFCAVHSSSGSANTVKYFIIRQSAARIFPPI
jgi:hypothetical protein